MSHCLHKDLDSIARAAVRGSQRCRDQVRDDKLLLFRTLAYARIGHRGFAVCTWTTRVVVMWVVCEGTKTVWCGRRVLCEDVELDRLSALRSVKRCGRRLNPPWLVTVSA
jgi:hypothetical protein